MSAIVVRGLTKKFRRNIVLDELDLEVYNGEIFSLMGLENSGKTTLARILFRFLKPNQGSISVFDMDALRDTKMVKEFCGYVPEDIWIYENLKPMSIFKKTLDLRNLKNMDDVYFLMDYFDLDNKKKFLDLSNSERKVVAIINALIAKPKLLILDEPTKFLSHGVVEKLFTHLRQLQSNEDLSVLLLTNSLSTGQRYGDRAAYMSKGRIVELEFLKEKDTNDKVLRIYDDIVPVDALESVGAKLLKEDQGESEFFYNGYLPTLTTILYQERVKNFTLEDAVLENKINSYDSKSKMTIEESFKPEETKDFSNTDKEINTEPIDSLPENIENQSLEIPSQEQENESLETTSLEETKEVNVVAAPFVDEKDIQKDNTIVVEKPVKEESLLKESLEDKSDKAKEFNGDANISKTTSSKFSTSWLGDTHTETDDTIVVESLNNENDRRG